MTPSKIDPFSPSVLSPTCGLEMHSLGAFHMGRMQRRRRDCGQTVAKELSAARNVDVR